MAAGNIMVAHNSGGPKMDIVRLWISGFLAETPREYAESMAEIIGMTKDERDAIRRTARESVERFSEENFNKSFWRAVEKVL